jgi:hypothetical protein
MHPTLVPFRVGLGSSAAARCNGSLKRQALAALPMWWVVSLMVDASIWMPLPMVGASQPAGELSRRKCACKRGVSIPSRAVRSVQCRPGYGWWMDTWGAAPPTLPVRPPSG